MTDNTLTTQPASGELESPDYQGKAVRLCTDGKYRWTYPYNMYKNPSIILTVAKIYGIIALIGFIIAYFRPVIHGEFSVVFKDLKYWGIAVLVFLAILIVAYAIVASMYGGKYIVQFTMDEKGILHELTPEEIKKARKLGAVVGGAGAVGGSIGRVGQGMLIASHTSLSSDFSVVRSIKPFRFWSTIKVNEPFAYNQVYTTREDFDFVLDYIRSHCPKAKK